MPILKSIKKLYYKFLGWLHKRRLLSKKHLDSILSADQAGVKFQDMVRVRTIEAMTINRVPSQRVTSGDSIFHLGEQYIEENGKIVNTAIGGDTTGSFWDRMQVNVLIYQPEMFALHLGGNDGLRGDNADFVVGKLIHIIKELRKHISRVAWLEIMPLGNPHNTDNELILKNAEKIDKVNKEFIPEVNALMKKRKPCDIIPIYSDTVGLDGYIIPSFGLDDKIHVTNLAYQHVYQPKLYDWFKV